MDIRFEIEPRDTLVVHLREGAEETSVSVAPARAGVESLGRALETALADGYGECLWPAFSGGQYWWMLKRDAEALEVIAMWTRGGASLWEHVFRATDAAEFIAARFASERDRVGLQTDLEQSRGA